MIVKDIAYVNNVTFDPYAFGSALHYKVLQMFRIGFSELKST